MATASPTIAFDNTSDATWRTWGAAVSAQFAAMGLVRSSDKGQVDWTTTVRGSDGVMTSGSSTLTSASVPFSPFDVGKSITVNGAGAAGANLTATISTYVGPTQVTLSSNASTSVGAATFSTLSTRSNVAGFVYEMWCFNDALQATAPVFIKVEYMHPSNITVWGFCVTIGFATDGRGSLTGQNSGRLSPNSTTGISSSSVARQCYFSGAPNRFAMLLGSATTSTSDTWFFSVERSKDAAGADTNAGAIVSYVNGSKLLTHASLTGAEWVVFMFVPATGGVPNAERRFPTILSTAPGGTSAFGTLIGAGTTVPIAGGPQNPGICQLIGLLNDFTVGSQFTIPVYGTNRNYLSASNNLALLVPGSTSGDGSVGSVRLLMLYE